MMNPDRRCTRIGCRHPASDHDGPDECNRWDRRTTSGFCNCEYFMDPEANNEEQEIE